MSKEKDYNNHKKEFMENINKEYHTFRKSMLLKNPQEIYESYGEIYFYECLYEYFQYNENIDGSFIDLVHDTKNIISKLEYIYEDNEYLTVYTWNGIDNIIDYYMQ
ncbi:MAG: hypothetical protein HFH68_16450 [Lachnospiraceae bacterium]|nr:hypothetical protein [Lachnospiraceae bacterium]